MPEKAQIESRWMKISKPKSFQIIAFILVIFAGFLMFHYGKLRLEIAMANEQVRVFESMRVKSLGVSPLEAAQCLEYVQHYYPSGSKQETGSKLDEMVERGRSNAIREMVAHLRETTGKDLGEKAESWMEVLEAKK